MLYEVIKQEIGDLGVEIWLKVQLGVDTSQVHKIYCMKFSPPFKLKLGIKLLEGSEFKMLRFVSVKD